MCTLFANLHKKRTWGPNTVCHGTSHIFYIYMIKCGWLCMYHGYLAGISIVHLGCHHKYYISWIPDINIVNHGYHTSNNILQIMDTNINIVNFQIFKYLKM